MKKLADGWTSRVRAIKPEDVEHRIVFLGAHYVVCFEDLESIYPVAVLHSGLGIVGFCYIDDDMANRIVELSCQKVREAVDYYFDHVK